VQHANLVLTTPDLFTFSRSWVNLVLAEQQKDLYPDDEYDRVIEELHNELFNNFPIALIFQGCEAQSLLLRKLFLIYAGSFGPLVSTA
jgi:hypothetical protein